LTSNQQNITFSPSKIGKFFSTHAAVNVFQQLHFFENVLKGRIQGQK
jgi:hypothetical protein